MDRTARTPSYDAGRDLGVRLDPSTRPVVDIAVIDAEEAAAWDDYAETRGVPRPSAA